MSNDILTTGQVAALCGVSTRTVHGWIDGGVLAAWRVPGPGRWKHRRISRAELERSGLMQRKEPRS